MALFFAGVTVGIVVTASGLFAIFTSRKNQEKKLVEGRERVMHAIGELWVDIDSLLSSFRCGLMQEQSFRDGYTGKIDAVNRLLKPNLYLFDSYYVKYVESLVREYNRTIHTQQTPGESAQEAFDAEGESAAPQIYAPEATDLLEVKQLDVAEEPEEAFGYDALADVAEESPVAVVPAEPSGQEEQLVDQQQPEVTEVAIAEEMPVATEEAESQPKADADFFESEDFSMETIIDLDISKLAKYTGASSDEASDPVKQDEYMFETISDNSATLPVPPPKSQPGKKTKKKPDSAVASVRPSTSSGRGGSQRKDRRKERYEQNKKRTYQASASLDNSISEETTFTSVDKLERLKKASEEAAVVKSDTEITFEVKEQAKLTPAENKIAMDVPQKRSEKSPPAAKKDEGITGEDVADQIDNLFGLFK